MCYEWHYTERLRGILADEDITTSTQAELKAVSGNKLWSCDHWIVYKCGLNKQSSNFIADFLDYIAPRCRHPAVTDIPMPHTLATAFHIENIGFQSE